MASMTIRNLDAETAAAVKRHAAAGGRTLAEELRFLAGSAGIAEAASGDNPPPERELTGMEKLALVREVRAKQTKVWPSCAPLIRRVRKELAAHAEAKVGAAPPKNAAARNPRAQGRK